MGEAGVRSAQGAVTLGKACGQRWIYEYRATSKGAGSVVAPHAVHPSMGEAKARQGRRRVQLKSQPF